MSTTELWFLKEAMEAGAFDLTTGVNGYTVRTPKFGYDECYVDLNEQRFLIKHRTEAREIDQAGSWNGAKNVVFFVRKHKNSIGK